MRAPESAAAGAQPPIARFGCLGTGSDDRKGSRRAALGAVEEGAWWGPAVERGEASLPLSSRSRGLGPWPARAAARRGGGDGEGLAGVGGG